jgi:hypothetical protein
VGLRFHVSRRRMFNRTPTNRVTLGAPTIIVLNIHTLKKGAEVLHSYGVALMRTKNARARETEHFSLMRPALKSAHLEVAYLEDAHINVCAPNERPIP